MTTFRSALDDQLQGYLDHLTIERGVAANTLSSYRRDLRRYSEHLALRGIDDLAKVAEVDVSDFLVALRRGDPDAGTVPLSAVSAARALIAVRGLHRFAEAEGLTALNVASAVKPPTPSRRLPKSLSIDEVLALLDGAGGDSQADGPLTLRNRALLELLYSTGARISEAVGLDIDDIDTKARAVLLRGKGGKQRLVPIGRPAVYRARRLLRARAPRPGPSWARHPGDLPQRQGRTALAPKRLAGASGRRRTRGHHLGGVAARAAPFVRHPPARRRRRRPRRPGTAGARVCHHDADLHDGHRERAARGMGRSPPTRTVTVALGSVMVTIRSAKLRATMSLHR